MSRIMGVVVALATATAVLSGSTAGGAAPPAATTAAAPAGPGNGELPREIERGVELTLADGDLFHVWVSENQRTVWSKRRDAATATWGEPRVVLREDDLSCGSVDARTAGGAVAVMARCDPGSYAEDQVPSASRALWSADTLTWSAFDLGIESYEEPGISPDGTRAVWLDFYGYVTWGPEGFTRYVLDNPSHAYAVTATISDAAQVSVLFGAYGRREACRLVVLTRTGAATPSRQDIAIDDACQEVDFANVDANTTWFGSLEDSGYRAVVSRPDAASPWSVTAIPPASAPGLEVGGDRHPPIFTTAPSRPLLAVGSTGRTQISAQAYDRETQTWGPPSPIHDTGTRRCSLGGPDTVRPVGVVVVLVRCGRRTTVLTTSDGVAWRALRMGRHVLGVSRDDTYVAVPGRSRTYVVSPELGVVTLPGGVSGRCDVVVPDGPSAAVLLTSAGRHRGWPTVLKASSEDGWRTLSRTRLPTFATGCLRAQVSAYDLPYRFDVVSRFKGYTVRLAQLDGEWRALRSTR